MAETPDRRLRGCVERWPEAATGGYDPRCCRFPKSCSATVYDETAVADADLEPAEPAVCPSHGTHPHNGPGVVHGGATCLDCPICRPSAPEPQPESDLLDLVRQYGVVRYAERADSAQSVTLFARIEAEVNRLRENDATGDLQAQRDETLAQRDQMTESATGWMNEARRQAKKRDELFAEVERLKADVQYWKSVVVPRQDGTLVLALPEVPEGAVALVGKTTRVRYGREATSPVTWRIAGHRDALTLLEVFQDSGPQLEVEMAPPREPRTWPKLDDQSDDDLPDAVAVNGEVWRRCSPDGVLFSDGTSGMTLAELRTLGEVREVFDT